MSTNFSTIIKMGNKAPFYLVMQLTKHELVEFIQRVSPNMQRSAKNAAINTAAQEKAL